MGTAAVAIVALAVAAAIAGVALLAAGLRGRQVDDHRLCRRCGFDLTGTPDAAICNECGRDLTLPKSTRVGHRERRPRLLTAAGVLLVPAALVLGVAIYGTIAGVDWQRHKPGWWLARDVRGGDAADRTAALDEFVRRQAADELDDGEVASALAALLDWQEDAAVPWDERAGAFVAFEREVGRVDDEAWARYARQGFVPRLLVRPIIRRGERMAVIVD